MPQRLHRYALNFDVGTTDVATFGSSADLNLAAGSVIMWSKPGSSMAGDLGYFYRLNGSYQGFGLKPPGANGYGLRFDWTRATTSLRIQDNDTIIQANAWNMVAVQWNAAGVNGDQKLWYATIGAPPQEPASYNFQQVGSGALHTVSSDEFAIGNLNNAVTWGAFDGAHAFIAVYNRNLSDSERLFFWRDFWLGRQRPGIWNGCMLLAFPGLHGASRIHDYSPRGNHGTATGTEMVAGLPLRPAPTLPRFWIFPSATTHSLVAAAGGASSTPDTAVLSVSHPLAAAASGASVTPDTPTLAVTRSLAADASGSSTAIDTAVLAVTRSLAATLDGASATPNTPTLAVTRSITASVAGTSGAPDTAVLAVTRSLAAAVAGASSTPDTAVLAITHSLAAALDGVSVTTDSATLNVVAGVSLAASITGASGTPDTAVLAVARGLVAAVDAGSAAPDATILVVARSLVAALAGASSATDTAVLVITRGMSASAVVASATPDTPGLAVTRSLAAALDGASAAPGTTVLAVTRGLVAAAAGTAVTPDNATIVVALITGLLRIAFSATQPGVVFSASQPGLDFSAAQPGIAFTADAGES